MPGTPAAQHPGSEEQWCDAATGECTAQTPRVEVCFGEEFFGTGICRQLPVDAGEVCTELPFGVISCVFVPPLPCAGIDACHAGYCVDAACLAGPVDCDDGDPCTQNACDPQLGCVTTPIDCDDGNECTDDSCDSEVVGCVNGPAIVSWCIDVFPIVLRLEAPHDADEACTEVFGTTACTAEIPPLACGGGDACHPSVCVDSVCTPVALSCDDGDECTIDHCDPVAGCVHTADQCDDGNACTTDLCVPETGECVYEAAQVEVCVGPDGLAQCKDVPHDATEVCFDILGLVVCTEEIPDLACYDGDLCMSGACVESQCQAGPVDCHDGDPCTTDQCDPLLGCVHAADVCDDGNPCTDDSCEFPSGDCSHVPAIIEVQIGGFFTVEVPHDVSEFCFELFGSLSCLTDIPPLPCASADACTENGVCVDSVCLGSPITCDDGDPCTTDTCNPQGVGANPCEFAPIDCDDGVDCTVDSCIGSGTCHHAPSPDCCEPYANCDPCQVAGDLDLSGNVTIVDVQCAIVSTLWTASGFTQPRPPCLKVPDTTADLDCSGSITVSEVILLINRVLAIPFSPALDADQNGCPDTFQ